MDSNNNSNFIGHIAGSLCDRRTGLDADASGTNRV